MEIPEIPERITRIVSLPGRGLLACDVRGGLHRLDHDLTPRRSSGLPAVAQDPAGCPVYGVALAGDWIITRDKTGTICRWHADTLRLADRLDARTTADRSLLLEGEQPSPTMLRGIGVWNGKAYVDNGYFQVVVLDVETFAVERIVPWPHGYDMLEWFCTDAPGVHAVADRHGCVHLGSLEEWSFPTTVRVDTSNVHRVVYDARHHRFWAIGDAGIGDTHNVSNGVVTIGLDGTVDQRMHFARNDVEGLVFSPDFTTAYIGGFDGELLLFDNTTPELTVRKRVTGFSHQIIDVTIDEEGRVYTLTQDGEITALSPEGEVLHRLDFSRQCVWDLRPLPGDPTTVLAATDDGTAVVRLDTRGEHARLGLVDEYHGAPGFARRAEPCGDDRVAIFWPDTVRRFTPDGTIVWEARLPGIVHTVSVSPDHSRVLVACNAGGFEFDAADGRQLLHVDGLPASAWASAYLPDGRRVLGCRTGRLAAYDESGRVSWGTELESYPKRLLVDGDRLRVTGGGGVKELVVGEDKPRRQFVELLDNTAENCALIDGTLCVVTYGMQIAAYDHDSGELLALHEDLPDFPKGMTALRGDDGRAYVVVGGRGGYLRLYRLDRGGEGPVLTVLRDLWLPRSSGARPFPAAAGAARP
ncbi:PQQ-binding-like beta-propeller repeat protein [Streptomyces sp. NPDC094149]|uniref:outer membrane protein assembly factor BamB family protein n=1 Tax=Streptomyces sp. NPDC094149 TaxID=3155079 RepID=UPI003322F4C6